MRRKGFVQLVGVGPGGEDAMSLGALRALEKAEEIWASDLGSWNQERPYLQRFLCDCKVVNLSGYYMLPAIARDRVYRTIAARLVYLADRGRRITFMFSGNPFVWVDITDILKMEAAAGRLDLRVIPSMSFLDVIWRDVPFSLRGGMQLRASLIRVPDISPEIDCVVGQVGDPGTTGRANLFDKFCQDVRRLYPPSHPVFVVGTEPVSGEELTEQTTVAELPAILPSFANLYYVVIIPRLNLQ